MKLNELTTLANHVAYKTGDNGPINKEFYARHHMPTTVTALKRMRAERKEAKRVTDPLADRKPGWVLVEAENRKRARIAEQVCRAFESCGYRLPAENKWVDGSGLVKIHVEMGEWPSIRTETEKVWHRKHAWSGNSLRVKVQLKPTYIQDVVAKGLQIVDGKLVLSATEIEHDVYALTLVEQSRGLSLRQTDAYLVRGQLRRNVRSVATL